MREGLSRAKRIIMYNNASKLGFSIVIVFILLSATEAVAGWGILPYNPTNIALDHKFEPPSINHPFGTNSLGTDVFSMVIAGAPNDAMVSFFVVGFSFVFGGVLGSFAAYVGGWVDEALMRVTDVFFAVPALVLAMAITLVLGPGPTNVMIALATIWWPSYSRLARAEALKLSTANFVESAKLSGISIPRIVLRHIYRIAAPTLLVYATLDVGTVVLAYSGLAYLGLAVRPPYPDWGTMVASYQIFIFRAPWLPLIPAFIIVMVALGFSLLGDGLKEALQRETGR